MKARRLLAFAMCLGALAPARAELPPSAYRQWQSEAPEYVEIEVSSVEQTTEKKPQEKITTVIVRAKITKVRRTASGLKPGAAIEISYSNTTHEEVFVGPRQIPILTKGAMCPAYLKRDTSAKNHYLPAAGGYSFEKMSE